MMDGYDPKVDSRLDKVSLEAAATFFGGGILPQYREDAVRLIPNCWDRLTPSTRRDFFLSSFRAEDYEKNWEALARSLPSGEAERIVITHLFGDTTNPLYE